MSATTGRENLRFGFYTDTFMYRSEVFFYRQAVGIRDAHVKVLARQGALLQEFPVDDLFLVDDFRRPIQRVSLALQRRLDRSDASVGRMQDYVRQRLARQLTRHPVDVLYTFFGWHAVQLLDVLPLLQRPVPMVWMAGGNDIAAANAYESRYRSRLPQAFEEAALILCASEFLRKRVIELGAPPDKVLVHYIGVDIPELVNSSQRQDDNAVNVLAVSRLHPMKGIPHTLRAFARVSNAVPRANLTIIGEGEERESLERLASELAIDDRVTFEGSMPIDSVYAAMRRADVFVQHSVRTPKGEEEGLGLSSFEAAAHGLPVVSTRSGGIAEGTVDGTTGILVEPGDEEAMADAIIALARNPERRRRMGAAGRKRMIRNFDLRKQNEKLEAILTEVALEHRRRHG